jgi:3-oxoacyl-[acyl-carrier-protein] synthase III
MAIEVVKQLVEKTGTREFDAVVFGSQTNEMTCPPNAAEVADKTGLKVKMAFDITAACAAFTLGVDLANRYIATGCDRVLVVTSELQSRAVNFNKPSHGAAGNFGDGAGGVVIERSEEPGLLSSASEADPSGVDAARRYAGRAPPKAPPGLGFGPGMFHFPHPRVIRRDLHSDWVDLSVKLGKAAMAKAGVTLAEVDWVICHQSRKDILEQVAAGLGATDKLYVNTDRIGHVSSASIPLVLRELEDTGRLRRGQKLLMIGAGAGLTGVSLVMNY